MELAYGSVCSGVEAATVAWEPLGWKPLWFSEIEKFASQVLAHHYPDVTNLGDMTQIRHYVQIGDVAAPDVLIGGTPCQAFSIAGLRNSLSDERGQLTLAYVHLVDVIDRKREEDGEEPAIAVWENVPGVLSTTDNAFGCFVAALSGHDHELHPSRNKRGMLSKWPDAGCVIGPTRTVAWRVLDAQYFGLAQRRRRVFVVASARSDFHPAQALFEFEGVRRNTKAREFDRFKAGEIVGTLTTRTGNANDNYSCECGHCVVTDGRPRWLTPVECERLQGFPDNYTMIDEKTADGKRYKAMGNSMAVPVMRWLARRIEFALTRPWAADAGEL